MPRSHTLLAHLRFSVSAALAVLSLITAPLFALPGNAQVLNADRGRIFDNGGNLSGDGTGYGPTHNYFAGSDLLGDPEPGVSPHEFRNYLLFSIPVGSYIGAELKMNSAAYGGDASETLNLFDYSGTPESLFTIYFEDDAGRAIFNDLGTGVSYGSITFTESDQVVQTSLNANALAAINALAGTEGTFIIGGALDEISDDFIFASSQSDGSHSQPATSCQLVLTAAVVPESSSLLLLLPVLGMIGAISAYRRRK